MPNLDHFTVYRPSRTTVRARKAVTWAAITPLVLLSVVVGLTIRPHIRASNLVPGQSYMICDNPAQFLTSPWTYHSLASGTQSYTVAQYQALSGYGTTLPPLPSYISSQPSTTEAAVIYAPGSTTAVPAYDYPGTPIIHFFEGGAYGVLGLDSISGDEFIGGSAPGFNEPKFDNGNGASGISGQNGSHYWSGGDSTLASAAGAGTTTVTTAAAIPGYLQYATFADGSTYHISSSSGTSITLSSPLTSAQAAGSHVWANVTSPIAKVTSSTAQGAATVAIGSSTIPLVQWGSVRIGTFHYTLNAVSGSQSAYTVGMTGGLDTAAAAGTPVYYDDLAGNVTVSYLDIAHKLHVSTGTIYTGFGWNITHNNIHDGYRNPGEGVAIYGGEEGTVAYNCISKMGDYAYQADGNNNHFDYNEVYESSYSADPGCGCSGAGKWWGTINADIVDNAWVNDGPGKSIVVWLDNGNTGTNISGNFFDKSFDQSISAETGFNLSVTNNLFQDSGWGDGNGCGDSNCTGQVSLNSTGGFHVPGSRYDNQVIISGNQFINNWGAIGVWQSGSRSCENSGEGWMPDADYCSGGFPNTADAAAGGQYYYSHTGLSNNQGGSNVMLASAAGSTTVLSAGAQAINDQIGFADPAATTTTSTTNVSSLSSSTINAAATASFPSSGQLRVGTSAAWSDGGGSYTGAILTYTGKTATSFTGVSLLRGSGTLSGPVQQVQPYKVVSQTCYANDCAVTISPALTSGITASDTIYNTGTCQLFATSAATPTSPLAPDGTSYWDGCQWGTKNISVTGNTFQFDPAAIAAGTTLGGTVGTSCTATHANSCGTNFMAFQPSGEQPFGSSIGANAMMSNSALTTCPSWDSGCTTSPLKNINALSNPPDAPAANGEPAENDVWSNNTYAGPWLWNTYIYGSCGTEPSDSQTGKSMPSGACQVDFAHWQSDWQEDAGSTWVASPTPTPSGTATPTPTATPTTTPTPTPTPTPTGKIGDLNNDGQVNIFDLSILLSAWGTTNPTADLNHDNTVNIFDLSILLSHWGT